MSHPLVDRLRAQRQHKPAVGAHTFIVQRPTQLQFASLRSVAASDLTAQAAAVLKYVTGWEGVTEHDIIAGGAPHPVAFDTELLGEWLQDRADLLLPLVNGLVDLVKGQTQQAEADEKNCAGGSTG